MIGERLKEERKKLGLNQDGFAAIAGVSRRAYAEWESGNTSPTAVQLQEFHRAGADVAYVVTGIRSHAGTPAPEVVDVALVIRIATAVETALTKNRARIVPAKKEELVKLLYDHFSAKGRFEEETVERHLKLVINH